MKEIKHGQITGISSAGFYNATVRHSYSSHRGAVCHGGTVTAGATDGALLSTTNPLKYAGEKGALGDPVAFKAWVKRLVRRDKRYLKEVAAEINRKQMPILIKYHPKRRIFALK